MKLSVANKTLIRKPERQECKAYFKDIKFKSGNFTNESIKKIIENGYTITYLYKDDEFDRGNHYMLNNYSGTQFICVDIDKCEIPPSQFVENIKYKPSILHTTFSNLTEKKKYKYCFHLLYFFDRVIYGEDNYNKVFRLLTDKMEYVDSNAKDCHRIIFTSNYSLPNYEYYDYGLTYKVSDFIKEEYDDVDNLFEDKHEYKEWDKISGTGISLSPPNVISDKTEMSQDTAFTLDRQFFNDMNAMKRGEFIYHYSSVYPYVTETYVDPNRFENGYADLRNENYYVVPTSRFRWDAERQMPYIPKIKEGNRDKMCWMDTLYFMKIIPNITKEYLVYLLTAEVFRHFDNSDGQLSNMFIINKCKEVWNNIDSITVKPIKKSFKIDKDYWRGQGAYDWLDITNHIRRQMKCTDFEDLYDCSMTIEQNISAFRDYGVNTTPRTLKKWLEENHMPYSTDKDVRDGHVIRFYEEDPKRSSREIETLCKENNITVNYRTVQRILSKYKG